MSYKFKGHLPTLSIAFSSLFVPMSLQAAPAQELPSSLEVKSEKEAFLVRRIAEFWRDQDYLLVKRQIHDFLEQFPDSNINDQLLGILGDLYLKEQKYEDAVAAYNKIKDAYIQEKTLVNLLQCRYELNQYELLVQEGKPFIASPSKIVDSRRDELYFLVAEGLFRQSMDTSDPSMKQDLAKQACPLYEQIKTTEFSKHSKLALAEIYNTIEDYEQSAGYFRELSEAYPDEKEDLLTQAALAESQFDPNLAIQTFSHVIEMKGTRANEAAVNRLILFFQEERFDDVINNYPDVVLSMSDEKKPTIDYIVGRSYFSKHDFKNAQEYLSKYISTQSGASTQLKNALLMQLNCTQQNSNDALCDQTMESFKKFFHNDKEYSQALFIHAMVLKTRGDRVGTEKELEEVLKRGEYEDKEGLFFEYGLAAHENEHFARSYSAFKNFISSFPDSENADAGWKYFLSCSINRLKSEEPTHSYDKSTFYEDLTSILNQQSARGSILSQEEERDCRLLSAKTAYELRDYAVSSAQLEAFIRDYPTDSNLAEAHLILGICYQSTDQAPEKFYENIERALALNPELGEQSSLHLQLYNAYLAKIDSMKQTLAEDMIDEQLSSNLYDNAAEHLFKAIELKDEAIKKENKLWLANHYYTKVKNHNSQDPAHLDRVLGLYGELLTKPSDKSLVAIGDDSMHLEAEVLKYAEILDHKEQHREKMQLLKSLAEQQTRHQDLPWQYQMQTLLDLAQSYESVKDYENALTTYAFITKTYGAVPSYVTDFAMLHANRIKFNLMEDDFKNDRNEQILTMLSQLKDLQIKKAPGSEPLHLEAAIEYAKIRSEIAASKEEKLDKYLFFLNRLKEDYQSHDDPMVREYHKELSLSPDKQSLFSAYMNYVDGEILRSRAGLEHTKNRLASAEELNSQALDKLAESKSTQALTPYLQERIQDSITQIDQLNRY